MLNAFYYGSRLTAYAFYCSSRFIVLITAYAFNIFIVRLLFCANCIFNFCIVQSALLLSLFGVCAVYLLLPERLLLYSARQSCIITSLSKEASKEASKRVATAYNTS